MKLLKKAIYAIILAVLISLNFQCVSLKTKAISQKDTPFKVEAISYQEWYTTGDKGGTGINLYVPIKDKGDDILIDSIYFRNLKGQLVRNYSRYTAVLKNNSPKHVFKMADQDYDYPFSQTDNECVIRYVEKEEIKYQKVTGVVKKERICYEDGPPLSYQRRRDEMVVSGEDSTLASIPKFQDSTSFKVKKISFQEWYAGIKVGGTGMNVFVPIVNKEDHIKIDSVYFRNLKGPLVENYGRYTAVLKNKSPYYTFKKAEKDDDYPFTLNDNECAISFVENGEIKYLKVTNISEKQGVYYENGPPLVYERERKRKTNIIASNF